MSLSASCGCHAETKWPFACHCTEDYFSYKCKIPAGHQARVRIFAINSDLICGIGIEQMVKPQGPIITTPPEGSCCRKPIVHCRSKKEHWFPYKEVACCDHETNTPFIKPWLMTPYGDCEICLPCGCYRFVAYDANYDPVVPEPQDIIMQAQIEAIC